MIWRRFVARRADAEADLDAEVGFHLDEEVRLRIERGESPEAARAGAHRVFGNVTMVRETTREAWARASLTSAWRSVSLIVRSFTRARGFAAAAILTVALGIGVNAVLFSMFDRVLFRPLPYNEPDRLVQLYSHRGLPYPGGGGIPVLPFAVAQSLARETDLFSGIAWAGGGDPEPMAPVPGENPLLWLTEVTTGTLDVLGVRPIIGAGFSAVRASDLERPVLLTYETWQRRFNGSDDVLALEWVAPDASQRDVHWRVVGVLPQGFLLPSPNLIKAHYDAIYGVDPGFDPGIGPDIERSFTLQRIMVAPFARLAPGVSHRTAQDRINALVAARFPLARNPKFKVVTVVPLQSGLSTMARSYVWLAVVGAWVVLGATCLTLAILLLTWSQSRRQAAGVRLALGASPRRLVVTALVESSFLCGVGAVVGWLGYTWARSLFMNVMPPGLQGFAAEPADVRTLVATGAIALASALVAGTVPAIRTSRTSPLDVLRPQQGSMDLARLAGGPVLLSVQAGFGVMLLVGAAAIVPGMAHALLTPPGFDATDLFTIDLPTAYDETATDGREQTRRGLAALDVVRRFPGVVDAALTHTDPFSPETMGNSLPTNARGFDGRVLAVDAGFFRTLATPMMAGRSFSETEVQQQALVAILNETGARKLWPGLPADAAIGRTVATHDGPRVVVGVAADLWPGLVAHPDPSLFLPLSAQEAYHQPGNAYPYNGYGIVLRMAPGRVPDRALLSDRLREQPWMIPNWVGVTTPSLQSIAADVELERATPRLLAAVFATLAGITLVLTTIAIYGLASFEIRRRREEMTVRLALGATPRALRRRLAIVIVKPVAAGALAGLPLSWVQVKLIGLSAPFVDAGDVQVYLAAATAILVAALVAAWLPGRRLFTMRVAELLRSS